MAVQFDLRHLPQHETEHGAKVKSICKVCGLDPLSRFNLTLESPRSFSSIRLGNPKSLMPCPGHRHWGASTFPRILPSKCVLSPLSDTSIRINHHSGNRLRRFVIIFSVFCFPVLNLIPCIRPSLSPQGCSRCQTRQGYSLRSKHSHRAARRDHLLFVVPGPG